MVIGKYSTPATVLMTVFHGHGQFNCGPLSLMIKLLALVSTILFTCNIMISSHTVQTWLKGIEGSVSRAMRYSVLDPLG
jgi:hypothetical protein